MRDLHESSALTITFSQAREEGACAESYRKMAEHVGGVKTFGEDTPLPIVRVLDVLGLDDALWALDAIGADRVLRLWACDCAERVLHIYEREYPEDRRPREALRVSRLYARGLATDDALTAAQAAAWAAGRAARNAWAARDAAYAAWDAAQASTWDATLAALAARNAWSVAMATARDAAWEARDAARDAERAWQTEHLRTYLRGEA